MNLNVHNATVVTRDQLKENQMSQSPGANRLYVKPIAEEKRHNSTNNIGVKCLSSKNSSASEKKVASRQSLNADGHILPQRATEHQSPSVLSINNNGPFQRNVGSRRSIGASYLAWSTPDTAFPETRSVYAPETDRKELTICVVNLPSLNELGFMLESYSEHESERFLGLRLRDRYFNRTVHIDLREKCPFMSGDLIVSVNQHRLSRMHESQAIRYVYNAFQDACHYTVEFGVLRDSPAYPSSGSPGADETRTMPSRSRNGRPSCPSVFSSGIQDPSQTSPPAQHRPRRAAPTSQRSVPSPGPKASRAPPLSPLLNNRSPGRVATPTSQLPREWVAVGLTRSESPAATTKSQPHTGSRECALHEPQKALSTTADPNLFNTRAIGQVLTVSLAKQANGGFGFTLTSRDTQVELYEDDRHPVYIKKILMAGAAIEDGRLLAGDRLLSVNQVEVLNLRQVLQQMLALQPGSTADLVISRQVNASVDNMANNTASTGNGNSLPHWPHKAFTYEYLVPLNDGPSSSEPPSLGVNLNWLNDSPFSCDGGEAHRYQNYASPQTVKYAPQPGLYVDSVLPDGLVSMGNPNRTLLPGDRLIGVNGQSLEGLNSKAIIARIRGVLNKLYHEPEKGSNSFSLTVHRYASPPGRQSSVDMASEISSSRYEDLPSSAALPVTDSRRRLNSDRVHTSSLKGHRRQRDHSPTHPNSDPTVIPFNSLAGDGSFYFGRTAVGRRSVSEKRHGEIAAKDLAFYQEDILPHRTRMLHDKQYSTIPTTRPLKIHHERSAGAVGTQSSHVGPMKALYQPEKSLRNEDGETAAERSSFKQDTETSLFRRGRKQNTSFRQAVDRSLNSDDSVSATSTKPRTGSSFTPPQNGKQDFQPTTACKTSPPACTELLPAIRQPHDPNRHHSRHNGMPNYRSQIPSTPPPPVPKRQPSTQRPLVDGPRSHAHQDEPSPVPVTRIRSSIGGMESLKGLFKRVSEKMSLQTRSSDNQQKEDGPRLSQHTASRLPETTSLAHVSTQPSGYHPTPPDPTLYYRASRKSCQTTDYERLVVGQAELPSKGSRRHQCLEQTSFPPVGLVVSRRPPSEPNHGVPTRPPQAVLLPPPLPPKIRPCQGKSGVCQSSLGTPQRPPEKPAERHPQPASNTPTAARQSSGSHSKKAAHQSVQSTPEQAQHPVVAVSHHRRHRNTGGERSREHGSQVARYSSHTHSSPSKRPHSRVYENKAYSNGSTRSPTGQAIRNEMVTRNGCYPRSPPVTQPANHMVSPSHSSRSHQSRATERLPMPSKKLSFSPVNPQTHRHDDGQKRDSKHRHPRQ